ncbi:hypothetical protein [Lacipirellula limnantheis]|uniref:Uncharacterized protein n=1 Tax=Lacipirellula limnantheis TaxID=2528024 RepID=A0A517TYZ2_9BACT|nr:hypothetical protein [Lacipirellula limnantheis]QDT73586.1 hypothetical protein I41_27750 [Lacipirellula limnantheis]
MGVDPDNGQLDLFDADKVQAAAAQEPEYLASTIVGGSNATQTPRVEALLAQLKSADGHIALETDDSEAAATSGKAVSPLGGASGSAQSVEALLKSLKKKEASGGG